MTNSANSLYVLLCSLSCFLSFPFCHFFFIFASLFPVLSFSFFFEIILISTEQFLMLQQNKLSFSQNKLLIYSFIAFYISIFLFLFSVSRGTSFYLIPHDSNPTIPRAPQLRHCVYSASASDPCRASSAKYNA